MHSVNIYLLTGIIQYILFSVVTGGGGGGIGHPCPNAFRKRELNSFAPILFFNGFGRCLGLRLSV